MPTVQEKMQSIIDKANATTGKTDKDLTTATQSLVDGFGGGKIPGIRVMDLVVPKQIANAQQFLDLMRSEVLEWETGILYAYNLDYLYNPAAQIENRICTMESLNIAGIESFTRAKGGRIERPAHVAAIYDGVANIGDVYKLVFMEGAK